MVALLGRVAGARPLHRLAGLHRPEPRLPIPPAASEREPGLPGFPRPDSPATTSGVT